jgi:RNA polymerase sigma-70 factor, ECF subfamily
MPDIDFLLWDKVKSGEITAYELLFQKYYVVLSLFSKRYTKDINLSREIVQDLFVYLWEYRNELSITSSFRSYMYRAVRFNSFRRIENEKKQGIRLDIIPDYAPSEFYDDLEYAELQERLLNAIEMLPEQCRKIFKMSRFEQLKYSEIATKLNLSVKTIEVQISKALHILQGVLHDYMVLIILLIFN